MAACGDAMLPSDYTGPPAGVVTGNVLPAVPGVTTTDARNPRLSLEWLSDSNVTLVAQPVAFQRSERLQHDWDIGLSLPTDSAKFEVDVAPTSAKARIAVAKMVYFDDQDGTGRIDWSCRAGGCNRVLAISSQYVVFVDHAPSCSRGGQLVTKSSLLTAGYHYFSLDLTELGPSESVSFVVVGGLASSAPTTELRNFAERLIQSWSIGC
jgi:hypothetical protein